MPTLAQRLAGNEVAMDAAPAEDTFAEIEQRFRAMHHATRHGAPPDERKRRALLERLRDVVANYREEFATAISSDFDTRARQETLLAEIVPSLSLITHTLGHLRSWMRPEKRATAATLWTGHNRVHCQPKGVVLIIAPWNYPLSLTVGPLAAALAAGNRVIIKPSELTPRTSMVMKQRLEAALGAEQVTVAVGGASMASALTALPFDHILYTGSTAIGRKVMAAAAANLTPLTLELGGKSPAILHEGCDLPTAISRIARGKLLNAGQSRQGSLCAGPLYPDGTA
jgi:acyl-CoA reductase-like NAD-dependent aldehyde dehydrogenase